MALTQQQIVAIVSPIAVGVTGYLVHVLGPSMVNEIGAGLGILVPVLIAVKNVWVVSPSTVQEIRQGSLRPGAGFTIDQGKAVKLAPIKPPPLACLTLLVLVIGCSSAQQIADVAVTVAGDVCKLVAQDDPTEPQWAQVACTVEGASGQVIVELPWASWTSALAQAKARASVMKKVSP
jgi:hypothetical protein